MLLLECFLSILLLLLSFSRCSYGFYSNLFDQDCLTTKVSHATLKVLSTTSSHDDDGDDDIKNLQRSKDQCKEKLEVFAYFF